MRQDQLEPSKESALSARNLGIVPSSVQTLPDAADAGADSEVAAGSTSADADLHAAALMEVVEEATLRTITFGKK